MSPSALVGQPPISRDDELVYNGLLKISPLAFEGLRMIPHESHHSRAPGMIIGASFAIICVLIITSTRIWIRSFRLRTFGLDDFTIIPATIGCVTYLSMFIATESVGCLGRHLYYCTYKEFGSFYKLSHASFPIFYFTIYLVKASIVLQNRRITGMTSRRWQIAHLIYLAILLCLWPISVFLNVFTCRPVATTFTLQAIAKVREPQAIRCLNSEAISLATRNMHIITDWLLLPVPLIIIWQLQLPLTRRIRLMLVFGVGLMSSVASIVRNILTSRTTLDITYDYYSVYAWDVVDIFFATSVASLPALNGIIDAGVLRLKSLGSSSSTSLFGRIRTLKTAVQESHSYDTGLSDREHSKPFDAVTVGKKASYSDRHDGPMLPQEIEIELQHKSSHLPLHSTGPVNDWQVYGIEGE